MEINIDDKAIQDAVVQAVADSAIGNTVKDIIKKTLTAKDRSFDQHTIFETATRKEVTNLITQIIREEVKNHKDKIREIVTPLLTDEVIRDMSNAAIQTMLGNLEMAR